MPAPAPPLEVIVANLESLPFAEGMPIVVAPAPMLTRYSVPVPKDNNDSAAPPPPVSSPTTEER